MTYIHPPYIERRRSRIGVATKYTPAQLDALVKIAAQLPEDRRADFRSVVATGLGPGATNPTRFRRVVRRTARHFGASDEVLKKFVAAPPRTSDGRFKPVEQ